MTVSFNRPAFKILIIVAAVLAVYGNCLNHGFVWDDVNVIVDHPLLGSLRNLPRLLLSEDIADVPTGYYRPLTYLSFALERAVWGLNPVGFNLTNLLLHAAVAVLFFRVLAALFADERLAFSAALLFALHPIAGETVNFHAGGRNTLLCAAFALSAILLHARKRRLAALACFTLAILSKEFALLTPVLLVLADLFLLKDKPSWQRYLPYAAIIVGYLALRSYVVATKGNLLKAFNFTEMFWIVPQTYGGYLANMTMPWRVKTMYDVNTAITWTSFLSWSVLLLALAAVAWVFRRRRAVPAAVLCFFLFLLPVSNLIPLGITMMADRYAYFALFGFSLGLAYLLSLAGTRGALVLTVVLCLLFGAIDLPHNGYWKNEITFFSQMVKDAPQMSVGFQNLGYAYDGVKDYANADKYLSLALTKKDLNARMLTGSSAMFWEMGELDKALVALKKKMELEPDSPEAYIMASKIYEQKGDRERARQYHDKAVQIFPGVFEMMTRRCIAVCQMGEEEMAAHKTLEAERHFKEALTIDPSFVPALLDLGGILAERGETAKALEYFSKAARLEPGNPAAHYNLWQLYEMTGKGAEAVAEKRSYESLDGKAATGTPRIPPAARR